MFSVMAPIKINKVVSVSSEDRGNSASNLLVSDSFKKWCVEKPGDDFISFSSFCFHL